MNTEIELLLYLQAGRREHPALDFGLKLAQLLRRPVLILTPENGPLLQDRLAAAEQQLDKLGIPYQREVVSGPLEGAILEKTHSGRYLVLFSTPHPSPLQALMHRSTYRKVMAAIRAPFIRVRRVRWPLRKILVCSGGLDYSKPLEDMGILLAQASGASLSILHVVEPVTLDYPLAHTVEDHWKNLIETDTPQGRHLRDAVTRAGQAGVEMKVLIRHGRVLHEILDEIQTGDYDLVGLGSTFSLSTLRHVFMPNVTALVARTVDIPLLCVRGPNA